MQTKSPIQTKAGYKAFFSKHKLVLLIILGFTILPTALRLIFFTHKQMTEISIYPFWSWHWLSALLVGTMQDCSLAFLIIPLFYLTHNITGARTAAFITSLIYVVFQSYYLVDLFLHWGLGIRMNAAFLHFLLTPTPFIDSAKQMGLSKFVFSCIVLAGLTVVLFWLLSKQKSTLRFKKSHCLLLLTVFSLTTLSTSFINAKTSYSFSNPIFFELYNHVYYSDKNLKADLKLIDQFILPRNENYVKVNAKYPLLKYTESFKGEKLFEIDNTGKEKPHIILLSMESFRAADVGVLGSKLKPSATPCFDRLAKEGVLFKNFHANGVQTARAILATLFGIYPRFTKTRLQTHDPSLPLIGLPQILKQEGYKNAYFYSGSLVLEHQDIFFQLQGFEEVHGGLDIYRKNPNVSKFSWGVHDEYLLDYFADWLLEQDQQNLKTFSTVLTITNHHPWLKPEEFTVPDFGVDPEDEHARFLESYHYSDYALGKFVDKLRRTGLAEKSIIIIMADTAAPMGEHNNYKAVRNMYQENSRIPLLILADGRLKAPVEIDDIGSQVDILPTVMDILGISALNHSVGTSLRRKANNRYAFLNSPFHLRFLALQKHKHRIIYPCLTQKEEFYDLVKDPGEINNIENESQLKAHMRNHLFFIAGTMKQLYEKRNFAPGSNKVITIQLKSSPTSKAKKSKRSKR